MTDDKNKLNGKSPNITEFPNEKERAKRQADKEKAIKQKAKANSDHQPILNIPPVVKWLTSLIILAFLAIYFMDVQTSNAVFLKLAFLPELYAAPQGHILQLFTMPFTHAFLHGGWFHLGVNIGMMLAFGSAVEKYIGGKKLLAIFLVTSAIGALTHLAVYWGTQGALIGASGGISGLFGALLRILQARGQMAAGWRGLMPITLLWVGVSVLFAMFASAPGGGSIAWTAHVGGFLGGMILYYPITRLVK